MSSVVADPEARAALARRKRERSLTGAEHRRAKAAFEADWPHLLVLDVSGPLGRAAGDLAERRQLRASDAVHLASYLTVADAFPDEAVRFSSADQRRGRAARGARRGVPRRMPTS